MHYIFQAIGWLEHLTLALGAGVGFWAFRRCGKVGYLFVAIYFCLSVFSLVVLPRINAEWRERQAPPTRSEVTRREINAAVSEAIDRVTFEEGAQPEPRAGELDIRFPLGPLVLVLGVWLLARRETPTNYGR